MTTTDEHYDAGYKAGYESAKANEKAAYTNGYDAGYKAHHDIRQEWGSQPSAARAKVERERGLPAVFGGGYVKTAPVVARVTPAEAIKIRDALESAIIGWDKEEDSAPSGLPQAIALADALIRNGWVTAAPEAKVTQ